MRFTDSEIQSTGAFLQGELERLDPTIYDPIADFTWGRDIDVREDVTIADEVTSFIYSTYTGGFGGTGSGSKSWIKGNDTTPARVAVAVNKVLTPLTPWGMEVSYDIFELQKAMQAGRPIDTQKYDAMKLKHQLDIDVMVYLGDTEVAGGIKGLLNSDSVANKELDVFDPKTATPEQIIDYFNTLLDEAWKATQYTRIPNRMLVPPVFFAALASKQLPNTPMNMLEYVKANNLSVANGGRLEIAPVKWLADASINDGKGRIVAYTKSRDVVRFPLVQLQSMPVQYRGYQQCVPYYGALGGVEFVRPEMVFYGDLKGEKARSARVGTAKVGESKVGKE